jgi:hypothetical protein
MLDPDRDEGARFIRVDEGAISTRRRDAQRKVWVKLSPEQERWLREIEESSAKGVDAGAVLRALLDLAAEFDIDWTRLSDGSELRAAVRDAVLVRRRDGGSPRA